MSDDTTIGAQTISSAAAARPPYRTFAGEPLTPEELQQLLTATESLVDRVHDAWFDRAHFLAILRNSLQAHDGFHGRAPVGKEKDRFAMSELRTAHRHGRQDPLQMVRYLKYRYEFAVYPKRRILKSFPIILVVEPTSVCNLRCPMCFIVDPRLSRNRELNGMMQMPAFRGLIDEGVHHGLNSLVMASRGEPTLNPAFPDMLAYARRQGVLDIKINTNATRLTPELSRNILAADPDLVVFSVDTANREVYGQIRVGADFDQVLANIRSFVEIRDREFPGNRTITRAAMVTTRPDQQVEDSREFWLTIVDEVGVSQVFDRLHIYELPEKTTTVPCSLLQQR